MRELGAQVAEWLTHFRVVLWVETDWTGRWCAPGASELITDGKWIFPPLHYFKRINSAIRVGRDVHKHQKKPRQVHSSAPQCFPDVWMSFQKSSRALRTASCHYLITWTLPREDDKLSFKLKLETQKTIHIKPAQWLCQQRWTPNLWVPPTNYHVLKAWPLS